ncbi:MAG: response regulator transcription factor [Solirubrobacteraceae bacterium]
MRVLVVEDEVKMAALIRRGLTEEGHAADIASTGEDALWMAQAHPYESIVLDVMLPGMTGFETCRRLRDAGVWTPVVMLTARDAVEDRIVGLDAGADDYLVKPFALEELLARVRALLRRSAPEEDGADAALRFGDLALDTVAYTVHRGARPLELTRTEFALLELFLRHPRQVLTRAIIFDRVWGYDFGPASNSLEVYVGYLRRKTEAGGEPRLLHTVRGVGYVLRDAP